MAHRYILDTHALAWFAEGNRRLSTQARAVMSATDSQLVLPLIALAEAAHIIESGRTTIPTVVQLLTSVYADPHIEIFALTLDVFERSLTP